MQSRVIRFHWAIWGIAGSSLYLVLHTALRFLPFEGAEFIWSLPVRLLCWGLLLSSSFWAFFEFFQGKRRKENGIAIICCGCALFMINASYLQQWGMRQNFTLLLDERMNVVNSIRDGEMAIHEGMVSLPREYGHLAFYDWVEARMAHPFAVYFPVESFPLDGDSGFMYRNDARMPEGISPESEIVDSRQMAEHWWWVQFR